MKTNIYIAAILFLSTLALFSCDDADKDTTKPVIVLHEPEEGQVLTIGEDVHFVMDLSDDVMLGSYKINIHNNFDGHGHGESRAVATAASEAEEERVAFTFDRPYDVSGHITKHEHHHDIVIPANAKPGNYHLMVYCTDAAGNETHIARNIVLSLTGGSSEEHHHE